MTTTSNYKERLATEFSDWLNEPHTWPPNENQIFDFLWSHFDTLIAEEKERVRSEIRQPFMGIIAWMESYATDKATKQRLQQISALLHKGEEDNSPSNTN